MESVPQVKKFHDPMKSNKLNTSCDMNQKVTSNGRTVILEADKSELDKNVDLSLCCLAPAQSQIHLF